MSGFKHHEMFQLFKPKIEAAISHHGNNFGLGATLALM
jgi:hemin uptake protein HemP